MATFAMQPARSSCTTRIAGMPPVKRNLKPFTSLTSILPPPIEIPTTDISPSSSPITRRAVFGCSVLAVSGINSYSNPAFSASSNAVLIRSSNVS